MKTFASFALASLVLLCIGWVTVVPSSSSSGGVSVAAGSNVTTSTNGSTVTVNATVPLTGVAAGANTTATTNSGVVTISATGGGTPVIATITDAANISWDGSGTTNLYRLILTGNHMLLLPSNPVDGKEYVIEVTQDGSGVHYLSATNKISFGDIVTAVNLTGLSTNGFYGPTNASGVFYCKFRYNSSLGKGLVPPSVPTP